MRGKGFLEEFSIGTDIIDAVADEWEQESGEDLSSEENTGGGTPAVSPPVGSNEKKEETGEEGKSVKGEKDGVFVVYRIGDIVYRIGGVKVIFVTNLRVNIRATNGKVSYYDSIDLYSSRGRVSFAQGLYRSWGANPVRVEQDLVQILESLEKERDEELEVKGQSTKRELSAEEKELGLSLLQDRHLFDRIVSDLGTLGYVGEELNKQLLYLCASSRKLDDPISVLIISQSSSGKSYLVDTVKRLMPSEEVVAVTSLSDQALNYIDDLMHKFLVLGEAVHGETVEYQIREMLSGKELSRLVTVKDVQTGKMHSQVKRTPVVVSSVMSSTNSSINPENASRCFVVNTDESIEQTRRIQEHQRGKYSLEKLRKGEKEKEKIIKTHQAAQRMLEKRHIVNEFAPLLEFPTQLMRTRRDHDRFMDLMACVCFLRQYQKKKEEEKGIPYITCDMEDYRIAYRIMIEGVLSSTMKELPSGAQVLYEQMRALAKREAEKQELSVEEILLTQRQIREYSGQGQSTVKIHMRQLVDFEYVSITRGGGQRSKGFYRVREDTEIGNIDFSMIPTPEAMKKMVLVRKTQKM